jgi:hypothetical protein
MKRDPEHERGKIGGRDRGTGLHPVHSQAHRLKTRATFSLIRSASSPVGISTGIAGVLPSKERKSSRWLDSRAFHGKQDGSDAEQNGSDPEQNGSNPEQNGSDPKQKILSCDRENRGESPIQAQTKMPGTFLHYSHRVSHPEKSDGSGAAPLLLTPRVAVPDPCGWLGWGDGCQEWDSFRPMGVRFSEPPGEIVLTRFGEVDYIIHSAMLSPPI